MWMAINYLVCLPVCTGELLECGQKKQNKKKKQSGAGAPKSRLNKSHVTQLHLCLPNALLVPAGLSLSKATCSASATLPSCCISVPAANQQPLGDKLSQICRMTGHDPGSKQEQGETERWGRGDQARSFQVDQVCTRH